MDAPADAEPLILARGDIEQVSFIGLHPEGDWLATADFAGLALWPLARRYTAVFRKHETEVYGLTFAPDGSWLASSSSDGTVKVWPVTGQPPPSGRTVLEVGRTVMGLAASPDGKLIVAGTVQAGTRLVRLDGASPSTLEGFSDQVSGVAFSSDGRLAAASGGQFEMSERAIRVWDVATEEEVAVLEVGEMVRAHNIQFTPEGHLLSASESGLLRWDVATGERELLFEGFVIRFSAAADGRRVVMVESENASDDWGRAVHLDLESGAVTRLDRFGDDVKSVAVDTTGAVVVTGDHDGELRVGPLTGEEPHLFIGHEGTIWVVAVDPRGHWVASGGADATVRLWPMPDLSKPPLHTLRREELIAKLKTLTNLRVVRDQDSPTGWKLEVGPFPGWATVPEW